MPIKSTSLTLPPRTHDLTALRFLHISHLASSPIRPVQSRAHIRLRHSTLPSLQWLLIKWTAASTKSLLTRLVPLVHLESASLASIAKAAKTTANQFISAAMGLEADAVATAVVIVKITPVTG